MEPERLGQIIFLNGTSSSGKTRIAEQLLEVMDRPYFHMSVDAFGDMRSASRTAALEADDVAAVLRQTRAGFHRSVAAMASAGNDLVVDHVLSEPWRLADCLELLKPFDVVFVGVMCAASELDRRERGRGDRPHGLALSQQETVHAHGTYDLICDTTEASPIDCALRIRDFTMSAMVPTAFERLRATLVVE